MALTCRTVPQPITERQMRNWRVVATFAISAPMASSTWLAKATDRRGRVNAGHLLRVIRLHCQPLIN